MDNGLKIISIKEASEVQVTQAAALLVEAFPHMAWVWPDIDTAETEIGDFFQPNRLALLAIDEEEEVVAGWIGGIKHSETLWELHPLAVSPHNQNEGVGTALVRALEDAARREGVNTIWLGSDDEFGGTNLFGKDLYPNVLEHLKTLKPVGKHPFRFYQRMGFSVIGVIPDSGGPGRHDILMAKRVAPQAAAGGSNESVLKPAKNRKKSRAEGSRPES